MLKLSEMKKQLSASRKSNDTESPFDRFVHDPIALVFSRLFIRLRIKPNAITLLSMAFGVTGALFFISHNWWVNFAGVLLQIFAAILDCCDGQVARLTKQTSRLGRVLDGTCDTVNFAAVYLALGIRMMGDAARPLDLANLLLMLWYLGRFWEPLNTLSNFYNNVLSAMASIERIFEIIKQVNDRGISVFVVEQNANVALSIADRGYVLQTGEVVLAGPARELLVNEAMKRAYLGEM